MEHNKMAEIEEKEEKLGRLKLFHSDKCAIGELHRKKYCTCFCQADVLQRLPNQWACVLSSLYRVLKISRWKYHSFKETMANVQNSISSHCGVSSALYAE